MRRSASGWRSLSAVRMIGEGGQESLFYTAPEFFSVLQERKGRNATLAVRVLFAYRACVVDRSLGCLKGWFVGINIIGWNNCQGKPALIGAQHPFHYTDALNLYRISS